MVSSTVEAESWGPVNTLLADVLSAKRTTPRWAQRRTGPEGAGALVGPQRREGREPQDDEGGRIHELAASQMEQVCDALGSSLLRLAG